MDRPRKGGHDGRQQVLGGAQEVMATKRVYGEPYAKPALPKVVRKRLK